MDRIELTNKLFQKSNLLTMGDSHYKKIVEDLFAWFRTADHVENDITSLSLRNENKTLLNAVIKAHQDLCVAGIEEVEFFVKQYPKISFKRMKDDGQKVKRGEVIGVISGDIYMMLSLERIILNVLGRMSGIATQTSNFVKILKNSPFIAATRKTPWMHMDKKAVAVGGGLTHRLDLKDGYLFKDNHLQIIKGQYNLETEAQAVMKVCEDIIANNNSFIEIEVTTRESIEAAMDFFSGKRNLNGVIMLDNWNSRETREIIEDLKKSENYSRIIFESSGNINEENIEEWANSGVDVISSGALTHSSKNADLSLEIE